MMARAKKGRGRADSYRAWIGAPPISPSAWQANGGGALAALPRCVVDGSQNGCASRGQDTEHVAGLRRGRLLERLSTYENAWVTDLALNAGNVARIVACRTGALEDRERGLQHAQESPP